jgi:hypothetical protein
LVTILVSTVPFFIHFYLPNLSLKTEGLDAAGLKEPAKSKRTESKRTESKGTVAYLS